MADIVPRGRSTQRRLPTVPQQTNSLYGTLQSSAMMTLMADTALVQDPSHLCKANVDHHVIHWTSHVQEPLHLKSYQVANRFGLRPIS